jgi:hypothetical protein
MRGLEIGLPNMKKAIMRRRLFLGHGGLRPRERTVLMVQQEKPLAMPSAVQRWIAQNIPVIECGTKLQFSQPAHNSPNYVGESWRIMVNLRHLARGIACEPNAYPKSVRSFIASLPWNNTNVWLVLRDGRVGTEMENWRGFAPKKG